MSKAIHLFVALIGLSALPGHAALLGVTGGPSSLGDVASIIAAPTDIGDDAATNRAMQGFDEVQGFTLLEDLSVDGGSIAAGTTISSHMLFLNSEGNRRVTHNDVVWTLSGEILGVMSDRNGNLESASSAFLGAPGTVYPGAFPARGMEGNLRRADTYSFVGNEIMVSMRVTEPGDWIRVVTTAEVPEPGSMSLLGLGALALGVRARRRTQG